MLRKQLTHNFGVVSGVLGGGWGGCFLDILIGN